MLLLPLILGALAFGEPARLPPKELYRVGSKASALANDAEGKVSQEAWDKYVVGTGTRFGLVPFRRGFYGGEDFPSLELYGNTLIGKSKIPWITTFRIKDECRTPEHVNLLFKDERFQLWVIAHLNDLIKSAGNCLNSRPEDCTDIYNYEEVNFVAHGKPASACDTLLDGYLNESKAKIVADREWKNSWYVRDRDCIESLSAKPADILKVLASSEWTEKSRQNFSPSPSYGFASLWMLMSALADSPGADPALLRAITEKTKNSDIIFSYHDYYKPAGLEKRWVGQLGPLMTGAYERCREKGRLEDFREAEKNMSASLQAPGIDHSQKFTEYMASLPATLQGLCQ
jgi:hypothetical protein